MGMEPLDKSTGNQLKKHNDSNDFDGATGGCGATTYEKQAEQQGFGKYRPVSGVPDGISRRCCDGCNLEESVPECFRKRSIATGIEQVQGNYDRNTNDDGEKDTEFYIFSNIAEILLNKIEVHDKIDGG